jgi:hypothetical protein
MNPNFQLTQSRSVKLKFKKKTTKKNPNQPDLT